MLELDETLTLSDNKKYAIVSKIDYNNKVYVFLIDQDDYTNTMFCEFDGNDGLEEVLDSMLIEELMLLFQEESNK